MRKTGAPRVLLVLPLPGIGDMIWHLPYIHALAKASVRGVVDVMTKPRSTADRMLAADPAVEKVIWVERNPGRHDGVLGLLRLSQVLAQGRYDEIWIFHRSWRYALTAWRAGIPVRYGFGGRHQGLFLNAGERLPKALLRQHPIHQASTFLKRNGIEITEPEPHLSVPAASREVISERYKDLPRPWIVAGIGSSEPFKQWGANNFADLVATVSRRSGATFFVLGGPAERELSRQVVDLATSRDGKAVDATGLTIEQSAALAAESDLFVGNDTGLLNVSAAVMTPSIGLFGASEPLDHTRFIVPVIPPASERSMSAITVEQVAEIVERHLGADSLSRAVTT